MTECVCADPEMCGGCDPTPDWELLCSLHKCRVARWAGPLVGEAIVRIRPQFARRRRHAAERQAIVAAAHADRVAREHKGTLFA